MTTKEEVIGSPSMRVQGETLTKWTAMLQQIEVAWPTPSGTALPPRNFGVVDKRPWFRCIEETSG
jgi:hypothetical protein